MSEPFLGTVMIWAPNFAPRGWAFCQGQLLAISTNSALFSLLGTVYGGNGTTTFGLPNLAGRVPIGQGQSPGTSSYVLGETSGTESVTLVQANLAPHTHSAVVTMHGSVTVNAVQGDPTSDSPGKNLSLSKGKTETGGAVGLYSDTGTPTPLGGVSNNIGATVQIGLTGNAIPFEILQPYQVLNYVIALEGVFPSRN